MSRRLDKPQQHELSAFVNALAETAGYETTAEWARDSGYSYPNLINLRNGKGAVDGFNLLRLIRSAAQRAGLATEDLALKAAASGDPDLVANVSARLDELAGLMAEALQLLRADNPQRRSREAPLRAREAARTQGNP